MEGELFGYERGAITAGAFAAADGGRIFLDEIGELSVELRPKLLRALKSRKVKRVGSNSYAPVDVRVIAASNRDLRAEVAAKRFRSDLDYRLAVLHIELPSIYRCARRVRSGARRSRSATSRRSCNATMTTSPKPRTLRA